MLSIAQMSAGQSAYYLKELQEQEQAELDQRSCWHGHGAQELGLEGRVQPADFEFLFRGRSTRNDRDLVKQSRGHQPGWDLCFSAPKSVSIAWGVAGDELHAQITAAHDRAVAATINYLEGYAAVSRRGHGGSHVEPVGLTVAAFTHATSRANDPHLHTHALALNVSLRDDGTTGTLRSRDFYRHKMAAGEIYRAELAHRMQSLGFALEPDDSSFRLKSIPVSLDRLLSSRRRDVERELERRGTSGPQAAEIATLSSRAPKRTVSERTLRAEWRAVAGLDLKPNRRARQFSAVNMHMAGKRAVSHLEQFHSYFHQRDVVREIGRILPPGAADARSIINASIQAVRTSRIQSLGHLDGHEVFATTANIKTERNLFRAADRMTRRRRHVVSERIRRNIETKGTLTAEQRTALKHLTTSNDLALVEGVAGTGKTYMVDAAREAWQKSGYTVTGLTLAGKAAESLQAGAKIPSTTIARFFETRAFEKLNGKSVIVVDEASMIATRGANALLSVAQHCGAKICFIGDYRQLPAIEAGGPFISLCATHGAASLRQIVRQHEEWHRTAITDLAEGRVAQALRQYAIAERLHVDPDQGTAERRLIDTWKNERTRDLAETLVLANTNIAKSNLNTALQAHRRDAGELGRGVRNQNRTLHQQDRVLVTRTDTTAGYCNGNLGTVERIQAGLLRPTATVRLDRKNKKGRPIRVTVPLEELDLGYAITTHKAQGTTVERSFILGSELQSVQALYTQVSRARGVTELFFPGSRSVREFLNNIDRHVHHPQKPIIHDLEQLRGPDLMR